jgi:type IV secretion system protein VirB6/type IV secretion system protein TrbL
MFTPSSIVDVGFVVFGKTLAEGSWWTSPIDSLICAIAGLGILFICAMIAINLLMLLITAWVLAYGGVFILGFGGSRWTSDIAINYYKHLLGMALQIMVMVLLIGVGWSVIDSTMSKMSEGLELAEMGVLFVVVLCVYVLANKIPPLLGGIVTGPTGGPPIGQYGGTAAAGAAGAAIGFGAGTITGASNAVSAIKERFSGNQDDEGGGSDLAHDNVGADFGGDSLSDDGAGASEPSTGNTPYAEAGGFANKD